MKPITAIGLRAKLYVDENTPQGVITEAEAKNWEVIYQSKRLAYESEGA